MATQLQQLLMSRRTRKTVDNVLLGVLIAVVERRPS
jgi:hypothetical protein